MQCEPCGGIESRLSDDECTALLQQLPGWRICIENGVKQLVKEFEFDDYRQAFDFTSRITAVAERNQHHPAILLEWGKVTLSWWTHKIGGLHTNDFVLAARSELVARDPENFPLQSH